MSEYGVSSTNIDRTERALDAKNTVKDERPIKESKKKAKGEESLLDMEKPEAARKMLKDWDGSWKYMKRYIEQWKVNNARSAGYTGVQLVKKQDRDMAYIPVGAKKNVAGMNKAARLSRRIRATIFSDPPKPECLPSGDSDEAKDAAEFATRILEDLCSEGHLAYNLDAGDAFDLGGDYGSGFMRFWVDPTGGGWRPKQLQASPQAVDARDPFPVDPATGAPRPCDPILRFVTEDGQFTEDRSEAKKVWLPALKNEVLSGKQVRFLPPDAEDTWAADGIHIGVPVMLGELKGIFEELHDWSEERIARLVQYRPQHFKDVLLPGQKDTQPSDGKSDSALVFVLTRYHKQSPLYPEGAYLIAAGEDEILHRGTWFDDEHGEPLDIPVTQFKQRNEEGNPYGAGNMTELGPGNELRSAMVGAMLEHLDRFANRLVFIPMTSAIQPHQLQSPTGTPIPILPGGEPKYEEIPDFPAVVKETLEFASQDMDDEADLQQAGQGLNPKGVKSGHHQDTILQQISQAMSDLKQNTERGLVRGWRIMLQLVRAHFSVQQQIGWMGDDGRYKQQHWTGADLGSTKDVRVARGSFSQMSPLQKAQLAWMYKDQGMLNPMEAEHIIEGNLNPVFGLQDNPHRMRVRRQIALWNEGPKSQPQMQPMLPQGVMPPVPSQPIPTSQPNNGGSVGAGAPVQPPAPPPNPFAPELSAIFDPVASDSEPQVAALRMFELGRALQSTKIQKHPKPWRQGIEMAYTMARQAAQLPDAKMLQGLQQELEQTKKQLNDAKIKANAPHVSFSGKLADLDEGQTQAILQQEGMQVPPRKGPVDGEKSVDPSVQLEHERQMHEADLAADAQKHELDLAADAHKHRMSLAAEHEKEKIRSQAKLHSEEKKLASEAARSRRDAKDKAKDKQKAPVVKVTPHITVNIPANKGSKVVRGKDGKIEGTTPNE